MWDLFPCEREQWLAPQNKPIQPADDFPQPQEKCEWPVKEEASGRTYQSRGGQLPRWPIHSQSGCHLADHDNEPLHPTSNATVNLSKFVADFAHIPCLMELCCYKSLIGGTCGFSSSSCTLWGSFIPGALWLKCWKDVSWKLLRDWGFLHYCCCVVFHVSLAPPNKGSLQDLQSLTRVLYLRSSKSLLLPFGGGVITPPKDLFVKANSN